MGELCRLTKWRSTASIVKVIPATANALRDDAWLPITDQREWADKPRWSPDGKMLYFTLRRDGFWNPWAVRFDSVRGKTTGAPFQVTYFTNPELEVFRNVPYAGWVSRPGSAAHDDGADRQHKDSRHRDR